MPVLALTVALAGHRRRGALFIHLSSTEAGRARRSARVGGGAVVVRLWAVRASIPAATGECDGLASAPPLRHSHSVPFLWCRQVSRVCVCVCLCSVCVCILAHLLQNLQCVLCGGVTQTHIYSTV